MGFFDSMMDPIGIFGGDDGGGGGMSMLTGLLGGGGFTDLLGGGGLTDLLGSGGPMSMMEDLFGRRPNVPDYPEMEDAQRRAITMNRVSFPEASEVAGKVNAFNQQQIDQMLRMKISNLDEINRKVESNISDQLSGKLPKDVESAINRKAAERAVAGGYGGSGMHRSLEARDLGLTSLAMTNQGMSSAERWIANVKQNQTAPLYDAANMFVTPMQKFQANEARYQRDLYSEMIKASPDPTKRGMLDTALTVAGMVLSIYGGSAGYQGQYEPAWQKEGAPRGTSGGGGSGGGYAPSSQSNYVPDYGGNDYGGWENNDNGGLPTDFV